MKKSRKVCFVLAALMLMTSLYGCGSSDDGGKATDKPSSGTTATESTSGGDQSGSGSEADTSSEAAGSEATAESETPKNTHITVWYTSTGEGDESATALFDGFIRDNPGYTIDHSEANQGVFGDPTIDLPRLAAAINAGTQPDLFVGRHTPMEAYYTNMFQPIHEFLETDPDFNKQTIEPIVIDAMTYNGKIYFMPDEFSADALIWNKNLFDEAGLDPDTPPKTWSQMLEFAQKLVKTDTNGKIVQIGLSYRSYDWVKHLGAYGEDYTDPSGTELYFTTENMTKVMEFAQKIPTAFGGIDKLPRNDNFQLLWGDVAMGAWSASGLGGLIGWTNGSYDFGIAPMPKPDDAAEEVIYNFPDRYWAIPQGCKNPEGGFLFMKWMQSKGIEILEQRRYESSPENWVPPYIYHTPTREAVYAEYLDLIPSKNKQLILDRDAIVEGSTKTHNQSVLGVEFIETNMDTIPVMKNEISVKDFLDQKQALGEALIGEWKTKKEGEGWVFGTEEYGVPPTK